MAQRSLKGLLGIALTILTGCTAVPHALKYETPPVTSPAYADGLGPTAKFGYIRNMAVAPDGNLIVADEGAALIRKVTPRGEVWSRVWGRPELYAKLEGRNTEHRRHLMEAGPDMFSPRRVRFDGAGRLWALDAYQRCIYRLDEQGRGVVVPGTSFPHAIKSKPTAAERETLLSINSFAVSRDGTLYVLDTVGDTIWRIGADGDRHRLAGRERGFADGAGDLAKFNRPADMVCDSAGNLLVADTFNFRVRKVTPVGLVTTLAGTGIVQTMPKGGARSTFGMMWDGALAIDAADNLYVADGRIQRVSPDGRVTDVAGHYQLGMNWEATYRAGGYFCSVAVGPDGRVYGADYFRISTFAPGGETRTLAGQDPPAEFFRIGPGVRFL